ncbi:hypothetical protein GLOIN_2v1683335, partial [Rhizophagus irregularis DAOM 181602=DAOM 197198]
MLKKTKVHRKKKTVKSRLPLTKLAKTVKSKLLIFHIRIFLLGIIYSHYFTYLTSFQSIALIVRRTIIKNVL